MATATSASVNTSFSLTPRLHPLQRTTFLCPIPNSSVPPRVSSSGLRLRIRRSTLTQIKASVKKADGWGKSAIAAAAAAVGSITRQLHAG